MTPNVTVYIKQDESYSDPIEYILNVLMRHTEGFHLVDNPDAEICFDHTQRRSEAIALHFYDEATDISRQMPHLEWMSDAPVIMTADENEDLIATCFYMLNCLQEREASAEDLDQYKRFKYSSSYQARFACITEDLVSDYFERIASGWNVPLKKKTASRVHISHDIDVLGGSVAHQVYRLGRQGRVADALESIRRGGNIYNNLDELDRINKEHGARATYFFMTEEGRGLMGIKNADYDIADFTDVVLQLEERGNEIGLHKSVSDLTFAEELGRLPVPSHFNRYHFLCHQPCRDWNVMESAGITVDCSLGFAEHYGFRNSYGLPFRPYDHSTGKAMNLVVSPLHIMDGTLWSYMDLESKDLIEHMKSFILKHEQGKVISILWHNTSITDIPFVGLRDTYTDLLNFMANRNIETATLSEITESLIPSE